MLRAAAAIVCLLAGCARAPSVESVAPSDPAIRYGGMFDRRKPDAPRFAWPGTHLEVRFSGTSLYARLSSTPAGAYNPVTDRIAVVIDGGEPKTLALAQGEHVYPLARGLRPGAHRALIWKRTEAGIGTITFHGFQLDAGAKVGPPLPPPARRMYFVGDSITAGFGADGADASCNRSVTTDNNYVTYGAVAARALGAEYVASAWTGIGIHRSSDAHDGVKTMPELYTRIIPTEPDSPLAPAFPAGVVVVNLGTNDFGGRIPDKARVVAAFEALLDELRARHPGALTVLMLGPMLIDHGDEVAMQRTTLRAWLSEIRAARGDPMLELLEVWSEPAEGFGCNYHPSARTHARLAQELAALVRARLGW